MREKVDPTEGMVLVGRKDSENICQAEVSHLPHTWTPDGRKWPQWYCPGRSHVIDGISDQERARAARLREAQ